MKTEPDYVKVGDYCFPGLTAKPYLDRGLDKYGLLRLRYLKEHRPIVWAEYVMVGKLYAYLLKVEDTAQDLLNNMMPGMEKGTGATKELKARDFCTVHIFWVDDCKIFSLLKKLTIPQPSIRYIKLTGCNTVKNKNISKESFVCSGNMIK